MSVSPQQLSDPCTPSSDDHCKRKRSPSPQPTAVPPPMVDGIREVGFRLRAGALLEEEGEGVQDSPKLLLENMAQHLGEVLAVGVAKADTNDFQHTIQLVNTLFEIAATLAAVVVSNDSTEQYKLDLLYQHAVEGLDLIGGEETPGVTEV